jgi:hypothetical protein
MLQGRKKRSLRSLPRDLLGLWACIVILFLAIGAFVARSNECVAEDVAAHPSYDAFPGLQTENLPDSAREALAARLNQRYCTCGCLMSVASCLNNHVACRTSRRVGLEMLQAAHSELKAAHRHP